MSPSLTAAPVRPLILAANEVAALDQAGAMANLTVFCVLQGAPDDVQTDAIALLRRAAEAPGQEIVIKTEVSQLHTVYVHDLAEAILADAAAREVAAIALGVPTGTTWKTRTSDDVCFLFATCTIG